MAELALPEDSVQFLGPVARAAMPQVYASAAVCVVPSRWENFPYVCLEAMASGCAVVASRVGGLAEIIEDGVNGILVEPGDDRALALAINDILDHPLRARQIGQAARAYTSTRVTRRAVCEQLAGLYESVLRRSA
jgi:glycosyltransferase involved in cell wall biosynthesis